MAEIQPKAGASAITCPEEHFCTSVPKSQGFDKPEDRPQGFDKPEADKKTKSNGKKDGLGNMAGLCMAMLRYLAFSDDVRACVGACQRAGS